MGEAWVRVEQYRTAICCNIDHRELIGQLSTVEQRSMENHAPKSDQCEALENVSVITNITEPIGLMELSATDHISRKIAVGQACCLYLLNSMGGEYDSDKIGPSVGGFCNVPGELIVGL